MSALKLYEVKSPHSCEDSSWHVVAATAEEAADLYAKAARSGEISVDLEEISDGGKLAVTRIAEMSRGPGLIPWEDTLEVIIRLEELPAWTGVEPVATPGP